MSRLNKANIDTLIVTPGEYGEGVHSEERYYFDVHFNVSDLDKVNCWSLTKLDVIEINWITLREMRHIAEGCGVKISELHHPDEWDGDKDHRPSNMITSWDFSFRIGRDEEGSIEFTNREDCMKALSRFKNQLKLMIRELEGKK